MNPNAAAFVSYTAAGGVVTDGTGEQVLLLIRPSQDEVRLPKGHIDPGETPEAAALREAIEETGYDDLEILAPLGQQLVVFSTDNSNVRRTEIFFLMRARSRHETPRPPEDEAQFFTIWVTWEEAWAHLTFEAEREWIRRARQAISRHTV
ncbi:MAG TPA: NUDIX domain-containing protein [Anaerolineae bacterium]|nr:NUDIX domain-containing protein [Anaerolineae bacterium]HQM13670.1 NUDIX domain-containing protein [Anaerolineae bacterium]